MEGIGEKVRQKSSLPVGYALDVANQPQGGAVSDAPHDGVQSHFPEFFHKGLCANPVVAKEHHGFLAVFMGDIHHFLYNLFYFPPLESLKVLKFL